MSIVRRPWDPYSPSLTSNCSYICSQVDNERGRDEIRVDAALTIPKPKLAGDCITEDKLHIGARWYPSCNLAFIAALYFDSAFLCNFIAMAPTSGSCLPVKHNFLSKGSC